MSTTADATRPLTAAVIAVLACALLAAPASAARGTARCPASLAVPATAAGVDAATAAITCLVNAERTSRGLAALRRDSDLARAARRHSLDMERNAYFSHTSRNGDTLSDRLRDAGYGRPGDGWRAGENLGWGTGERATPSSLVDAWLDSPPHRRIMLSSAYREIGVGIAIGAPLALSSELPGATYTIDLGTILRA